MVVEYDLGGLFFSFQVTAKQDAHPPFVHVESSHGTSVLEDGRFARTVERVHDVCVVRTFEELGRSALDDRGFSELGHRVF